MTQSLAEQSMGDNQHCLLGWAEANHAYLETAIYKFSLQGIRNYVLISSDKGQCSSHTP